jgi:hypothetical protein
MEGNMEQRMFTEIANKIQEAAERNQKVAMLHFQVLVHASDLADVNPVDFCMRVGINKAYATEFRKMLSLANLMNDMGVSLKP